MYCTTPEEAMPLSLLQRVGTGLVPVLVLKRELCYFLE